MPDTARGKNNPYAECAVRGGCISCLCILPGILMLAVGVPTEIELAKYDPATDFTSVEGGCTIVSVAYSTEDRSIKWQNGKYTSVCVDIYKYNFTKTGSTTNLISRPEEHSRYPPYTNDHSDFTCDAPASEIHPAELAVAATVPCWSPAPNKDIPSLAIYTCGNDECVKLGDASLSPAAEYAAGKGWGQSLLLTILGAVFITISLLCCVGSILVLIQHVIQDPEPPVGPLHGPGDGPAPYLPRYFLESPRTRAAQTLKESDCPEEIERGEAGSEVVFLA